MPFTNPPGSPGKDAASFSEVSTAAQRQLAGRNFKEAERLFSYALTLNQRDIPTLVGRGQSRWFMGDRRAALQDFALAFETDHTNEQALKEFVSALLEVEQESLALEACAAALQADPGNVTALIGRDWVLSRIAPLWHVPMMNEKERNQAYFKGMQNAGIGAQDCVFEIGTGSGLLSMMAARLGAHRVVTCEAKKSVAEIARRVVVGNGMDRQISVVPKPSAEVDVGRELERRADVLIHEIFSSELLNEGVLPAIEDAKARLLTPTARIVPGRAAIVAALVGGDDVGRSCYVDQAFGFDLSEFNRVQPRKIPLYREDLKPALLSADTEIFAFDFQHERAFPAAQREITLDAIADGRCFGLIQWIRIDFGNGDGFENHPLTPRDTSNWQHMVYKFEAPLDLARGDRVTVRALHDRSRVWIDLLGRQPAGGA